MPNSAITYRGQPPLILIGPKGVGKSTIARLIAQELGLPHIAMDQHCWNYYSELPEAAVFLDSNLPLDSAAKKRWLERIKANTPDFGSLKAKMELHACQRLLEDFSTGIIDFGAGHSVFQNPQDCHQLKIILTEQPLVVLLLPSRDIEEAISILSHNLDAQDRTYQQEHLHYYLSNPSNLYLAKKIILTKSKTPVQTMKEVLALLS